MSKGGRPFTRFLLFRAALLLVVVCVVGVSSALFVYASHRTDASNPTCTCSASISLAKPELQFVGGSLTFIPRVDISIRTRGSAAAPAWEFTSHYEGTTFFTSGDVAVPGTMPFSGDVPVLSGQCGNNRYSLKGFALPPVHFDGITPGLVGIDQSLDGLLQMRTALNGCAQDTDSGQFSFRVSEFGNLRARNWRSLR